jgi:putative intracellular protease/amidase
MKGIASTRYSMMFKVIFAVLLLLNVFHAHAADSTLAPAVPQPNPNVNVNGIGIYVYDGMFDPDGLEPYKIFKAAKLKVFLIAKKKGVITTYGGQKINVTRTLDEVKKLDVVLIPGGGDETIARAQLKDIKLLNWVKAIDRTTRFTTSVCVGTWIVAASGLLKGKRAATHWYLGNEMLAKYGAIYTGKTWSRDGKYWTGADVAHDGLNMPKALVNYLFRKTLPAP